MVRISFALPSAREQPLLYGEDANSNNTVGEPPHCGVSYGPRVTNNKSALRVQCAFVIGDPWENRTPVTAVKGRCLSRLTNGPGSGDWT